MLAKPKSDILYETYDDSSATPQICITGGDSFESIRGDGISASTTFDMKDFEDVESDEDVGINIPLLCPVQVQPATPARVLDSPFFDDCEISQIQIESELTTSTWTCNADQNTHRTVSHQEISVNSSVNEASTNACVGRLIRGQTAAALLISNGTTNRHHSVSRSIRSNGSPSPIDDIHLQLPDNSLVQKTKSVQSLRALIMDTTRPTMLTDEFVHTNSSSTRHPDTVKRHRSFIWPIRSSKQGRPLNQRQNPSAYDLNQYRDPSSYEQYLKLNVGGTSFMFRTKILNIRCRGSFLAEFSRFDEDTRRRKSHGFIDDTQEYFFERSPKLFDTIYKYYASGQLHRPLDVCLQEFLAELGYWGIPDDCIAPCCSPLDTGVVEEAEEPKDMFENLILADIRRYLWNLCEGVGPEWDQSFSKHVFGMISMAFVLLSVSGLILGTLEVFQVPIKAFRYDNSSNTTLLREGQRTDEHPLFRGIEVACNSWFTFEYVLRFFISPTKMVFFWDILNMVDFLSVLPFYLEVAFETFGMSTEKLQNFRGALLVTFMPLQIRVLRVLRVMRLFKLGRYSAGMRTFAITIKASAKQLMMMCMVVVTGVIFFSTMIYYAEKDTPDTPFTSIPAAFWWCVVTMSTVGYGDVVPVTPAGKIIATANIICGVFVLALPITVIVSNFMRVSAC